MSRPARVTLGAIRRAVDQRAEKGGFYLPIKVFDRQVVAAYMGKELHQIPSRPQIARLYKEKVKSGAIKHCRVIVEDAINKAKGVSSCK